MIKTKTAFIIFGILSIVVFPYYIALLTINSVFFNSIIPGWHTNIAGAKIISNLIKFLIISVVAFYYWSLSKITTEVNFKKFSIHLLLTIPTVLISKLNLYDFFNINFHDPERLIFQIKMVSTIHIFINILFIFGQVLFGIFYFRFQKIN